MVTLALVAACAAFAFTALPAGGDLGIAKAYADGDRVAKARAKWRKAVRVRGFYYRGGYYSYTDEDVINSTAWARSLFISSSTFRDPLWSARQSPGGPFDSGFFFDSGLGPMWNDAPYPR
jgi:hypothetical protein